MFQGSSRRVGIRVRVSLLTLIVPLTMALGLMLLGSSGVRATQILAHAPLTLYGGPGDAFSVLATLAAGAKVEILWCNAEATWCRVQNDSVEGWAPRDALVTKKGGDTGPAGGPSSAPVTNSLVSGTDGATASIVGPSPPPGGSQQSSSPSAGTSIGTASSTGGETAGSAGTSTGVSVSVSVGSTKLGVSVH